MDVLLWLCCPPVVQARSRIFLKRKPVVIDSKNQI